MQIVSIVSNPVFGKNKKNMSICRLLKILPRVLSVNCGIYIILKNTSQLLSQFIDIIIH